MPIEYSYLFISLQVVGRRERVLHFEDLAEVLEEL